MTTRCVMGMESEFGCTTAETAARAGSAVTLLRAVQQLVPCLDDGTNHGVYLASGARFYYDCGHPEYATPECESPQEVVTAMRGGERLLAEAARMTSLVSGKEMSLFRCNVDYAQPGVGWGAHESYRHLCDPSLLPERLVPHLVTRLVFSGAGGLVPTDAGVEFTLSPKAWLFQDVVNNDSTGRRGIFHTRDESLSDGPWHRLHVTCGESLCSDEALLLKLGSTALIVAAFDAGFEVAEGLALHAPVDALRQVAADLTCSKPLLLKSGHCATAIDIQWQYLAAVDVARQQGVLPGWAGEVCDKWADALDHLEFNAGWAARTLDWGIKHELFRHYAGGEEAWAHRERMNIKWRHVRRHLQRILRAGNAPESMQLAPERALDENSPVREEVEKFAAALGRRGTNWPEIRAHLSLRHRLAEVDLRFGQLGNNGVYAALASGGLVGGWRADEAAVVRAMTEPPEGGRAMARGRAIRELAAGGRAADYQACWHRIWEMRGGRRLDLPDPLIADVTWKAGDPERAVERLRMLFHDTLAGSA